MTYKPRSLAEKLRRMVGRFAVVVVAGARQVGKSTLICPTEGFLRLSDTDYALPWDSR